MTHGLRNVPDAGPSGPRGHGAPALSAHVEPAEAATGGDVTTAELSGYPKEVLPHHLEPAALPAVDRLPLTGGGEPDRTSLPPVPATAGAPARDHIASAGGEGGGTARRIAALMSDVLGHPVGPLDRFDLLGGDSLAAARVVALVRTETTADVSLADFIAEPTAAALARQVETAGTRRWPTVSRMQGDGTVQLTDMQRQLWALRQVSSFPGVTTEAFRVGIDGSADTAAVRAALDGFVARHEALRTLIRENADGPYGVVAPAAPVPLTEHDVRELSAAERDSVVQQAAQQAFDPARDVPLMRAALLRTGPDRAELAIAVDHLAFDGWSSGIFVNELAATLDGSAHLLPEPQVQPGDVARYEQELFAVTARADRAFWQSELEGAVPPYALSPAPRTAVPGHRGARVVRPLEPALAKALRVFGDSAGSSPAAVCLAALHVVIARWTGQPDVVVGVPAARRDLAALERVVAPLLTMLPVRIRSTPDMTFQSLTAVAALASGRALGHADLPAAQIADAALAAGVSRPYGVALTPVVLSLRPAGAPVRATGEKVEIRSLGGLDGGAAQNEATFLVNETAFSTEIQLCYNTERFDETTATTLLDGFVGVLTEGVAAPGTACGDLAVPEPPAAVPVGEEPSAPSRPHREPATVIEEFLAGSWCDLLGVERVAASDSFFDLGGTSLAAMRLTSEVWEALGVELSVRTVFELPVLSDLAEVVEQRALAALDQEDSAR
ncbi:condensation domain-containing protein [Streptomyces pseudovenezuelae]|uniref:Acyl carrier protein n=1 Tax=Streptomyces pseudovenezuelae TaxID=67350 RepID=A0ABT6M0P4_9ACTN|nr:condensation domain-containing protein [Streptomyces pseudovenezuelae]MDH6222143.1 acyl carrier protein [Streptomyces pseudovenezuelae]